MPDEDADRAGLSWLRLDAILHFLGSWPVARGLSFQPRWTILVRVSGAADSLSGSATSPHLDRKTRAGSLLVGPRHDLYLPDCLDPAVGAATIGLALISPLA